MDTYKDLAYEALRQHGDMGETLFAIRDVDVCLHRVQRDDVRDKGNYLTVLCPEQGDRHNALRPALVRALQWLLTANAITGRRTLVVGLGNERKLCDALGTRTLAKMHPDARCALFAPGPQSHTGIPSGDSVRYVAHGLQADAVVAVDTLACSAPVHLCRSIQLSDAGIRPGAGLGNGRKPLSRATLGVPVLYVGVPLISYVDAFCDLHCVIPQAIEDTVDEMAALLAGALTDVLQAL